MLKSVQKLCSQCTHGVHDQVCWQFPKHKIPEFDGTTGTKCFNRAFNPFVEDWVHFPVTHEDYRTIMREGSVDKGEGEGTGRAMERCHLLPFTRAGTGIFPGQCYTTSTSNVLRSSLCLLVVVLVCWRGLLGMRQKLG
jgi:hypothetical protein